MTQTTDADASAARAQSVVRAEDVTVRFTQGGLLDRLAGRRSVVHAVENVTIAIGAGETVGLVGESGCGKSTLGRTLLRLYRPTSGRVYHHDDDITSDPESRLRPRRRQLQMIFQDPKGSLNPRLTVQQTMLRVLKVHGVSGDAATQQVADAMRRAGLEPDRFRDRYPSELSGGEAQRVGIARALLLEPELIVADEPVSSLDVTVQAQIVNLLADLRDRSGLGMLFISHDMAVVRHISDRIVVMYLGQIMEEGPTDDIFRSPSHPYTQALLDAVPDASKGREVSGLSGQIPSPSDPPSGCPFHTRCPVKIGPICETERPKQIGEQHRVACHLFDENPGAQS